MVPKKDFADKIAFERSAPMLENMFNHSAEVEMWLDCGEYGKSKLSRISPRFVVLHEPFDAPAGNAHLIVHLDGKKIERKVMVVKPLTKTRSMAFVHPITDIPF